MALHLTASGSHDSTVQLLVQTLGADKEVKDTNRKTALHHAASNGHDPMVQLLVEAFGVKKGAKDRNVK
jgi:ankyrin repeat protein